MNLQYGKFFKYPRKAFKHFLSVSYPLVIKIYPLPKVKSIPETIDKILDDDCSICRFGDGELLYIAEKRSLPFQRQDDRLRDYFIKILNSENPKILVGLPIGYYSLENLKPNSKRTWRAIISWTYPRVRGFLRKDKEYYNASMTRLYMDYDDTSHSEAWFRKVRSIWEEKDILLIEGEKSRLGVGNDLFKNSRSVKRVLGPAHNAFDQFDDLLNFAKEQYKKHLVLIAMGPTAKPLAYELALLGFQAIDIGNLDVEYEWFLQKAKSKVKIEGKYTSEAKGGRIVEDIINEEYENQIIKKFLNISTN
ncbi:GT-D fold domain-containing glycosyltransferase [Mesonia ostreae]|uniref:GT-D fold domain-containing glycosyltransferase n=1 Tax=Mesonia ostreae TaxID=861110 RepID=A0ABU2KH73_9FLAO|nr:GT-D fold domain-containing glycosyltransferase [Mesonia ostreae]MDT0294063.1 GT-D fold domain-containing glycosyltransferase [Mesonia ostreae]